MKAKKFAANDARNIIGIQKIDIAFEYNGWSTTYPLPFTESKDILTDKDIQAL